LGSHPTDVKSNLAISDIAMKNLAAIDLNLLVVFEALLAERNVSRAGDRIGLAQPSISRALGKLRALFGDELFVRTPKEMRPTTRALELAAPIAAALDNIRSTLRRQEAFDPATSHRKLAIGATFYANFTMLPAFIRVLRSEAPNLSVFVRALGFRDAIAFLDEGKIDLAIGVFADMPKRIATCELTSDSFVCISRANHPGLAGGLTLESFVAHAHARWSLAKEPAEAIDAALGRRNLKRRIALVLQGFYPLVVAVASSDLLAVVPAGVAHSLARREAIDVHPLPLDLPPLALSIAWCRHSDVDAAACWMRERICSLVGSAQAIPAERPIDAAADA
jgi:DNA-binding transcriptional LysR family regulator